MCRKYFCKINADQQDSQGRTHETAGHKPRCSPPYRNQDFSQLVCQFLIHKRSGRTATSTVFLKKKLLCYPPDSEKKDYHSDYFVIYHPVIRHRKQKLHNHFSQPLSH